MRKKTVITAATLLAVCVLFCVLCRIGAPGNVKSVTVVDMVSGTEKTLTGEEAGKVVTVVRRAWKLGGSVAACPASNIQIYFNTKDDGQDGFWVCLSGDSCATIYNSTYTSYNISERGCRILRQIVEDNGFEILPC